MIKLYWRIKGKKEIQSAAFTFDLADAQIAFHRHNWDMFYCEGMWDAQQGGYIS